MKRVAVAGLAVCALLVMGQTKPASPPASDAYPALQRRLKDALAEVESLKAQIEKLVRENDHLKSLLEAKQPSQQPATQPAASPEEAKKTLVEKIRIGMKRSDVQAYLGVPRDKTREGMWVVETHRFYYETVHDPMFPNRKPIRGRYDVVCRYTDDGLLADISGYDISE